MAIMKIEKIKHGKRVLSHLPQLFNDLVKVTCLDAATLRRTLMKLQKYGYVMKDGREFWVSLGERY